MEAATGKTPPELIPPDLPECATALWQTFLELNATRSGGMGPSPIGLPDLVAWQHLQDVTLTPWEIDTLLAMDSTATAAMQKDAK